MFEFFSTKKLSLDEIEKYNNEVENRCSAIRTYLLGIANSKNKVSEERFFEPSLINIQKNIEGLYPFIVSEKKALDKINSNLRNLFILKETLKNRYLALSNEKNLQEGVNNFNRDVDTFKGLCVELSNLFQTMKLKEISYLESLKQSFIDNQRKAA